jgi:hypothetical protein
MKTLNDVVKLIDNNQNQLDLMSLNFSFTKYSKSFDIVVELIDVYNNDKRVGRVRVEEGSFADALIEAGKLVEEWLNEK